MAEGVGHSGACRLSIAPDLCVSLAENGHRMDENRNWIINISGPRAKCTSSTALDNRIRGILNEGHFSIPKGRHHRLRVRGLLYIQSSLSPEQMQHEINRFNAHFMVGLFLNHRQTLLLLPFGAFILHSYSLSCTSPLDLIAHKSTRNNNNNRVTAINVNWFVFRVNSPTSFIMLKVLPRCLLPPRLVLLHPPLLLVCWWMVVSLSFYCNTNYNRIINLYDLPTNRSIVLLWVVPVFCFAVNVSIGSVGYGDEGLLCILSRWMMLQQLLCRDDARVTSSSSALLGLRRWWWWLWWSPPASCSSDRGRA